MANVIYLPGHGPGGVVTSGPGYSGPDVTYNQYTEGSHLPIASDTYNIGNVTDSSIKSNTSDVVSKLLDDSYNNTIYINPSGSNTTTADLLNGLHTNFSDYYDMALGLQESNNAYAAEAARIANNFSADQARITRDWNAAEAAKSREWSTMMSDSSHQREVSDLLAAGLNPILSVNGGASAYTGATASASNPASHAQQLDFGQALGSLIPLLTADLNNAQRRYELERSFDLSKLEHDQKMQQLAYSGKVALDQSYISAGATNALANAQIENSKREYNGLLERQEKQLEYDREQAELNRTHEMDLAKERHWDTKPGSLKQYSEDLGSAIDSLYEGAKKWFNDNSYSYRDKIGF